MAAEGSKDNFMRAFVPGLVLGLVVGAFAGVVLVDLIKNQPPRIEHAGTGQATGDRDYPSQEDRDALPVDPETDPQADPDAEAPTGPDTEPAAQPETPTGV